MFANLLKDLNPLPFYEKKEAKPKYDNIVVIDQPKVTMGHPLIDFNVKRAKTLVIDACECDPAPRSKPLVAVVRGSGGGKTRTIVEVWLELNESPHVLAIAITFNGIWTVNQDECGLFFDTTITSPAERHCTRLLCRDDHFANDLCIFRFGFSAGTALVEPPSFLDAAKANPEELLRSFVAFLVSCLHKPGITHFVLLVDETAAVNNIIHKVFQVMDVTSTLREGLLSFPTFKEGTDILLHVGIVISSLELTPIGQSLSHRIVHPLELPLVLSPDQIVQTWWKQGTAWDPTVLHFAAALFASVPRLVEIAASFITKTTKFEELLKMVCRVAGGRYPHLVLPSQTQAHFLRAAVFREEVKLDKDAMHWIQNSMFVNSLVSFAENSSVVLESNLMMLVAACPRSSSSPQKALLEKMLLFEDEQAGDFLELLLYRWMNFRFAFIEGWNKDVGLGVVLQLGAYETLLAHVPPVHSRSFLAESMEPKKLKTSSHENKAAFIAEIAGLARKAPIQIYLSCKGDAFDFLLVFGEWLLFLDAKSFCDEKQTTSSGVVTKTCSAQADHMKGVVGDCTALGVVGWHYIYFATHNVVAPLEMGT